MTVKRLEETAEKMGIDIASHRRAFEKMQQGRDLKRLRHTGGYTSPPIAALWAQHLKTTIYHASNGEFWH